MKKAKKAIPNQHLIDERIRNKWSQQDIADRIGTTSVNVSRWERGATSPNPYFRQQLVTLFGKSLEELGLLPLESPSPEIFEQAPSPSPLPSEEQEQETALPPPTQFTLPYAPPPPVPAPTHFHTWRSLRPSFTTRAVTLSALVLLLVAAGFFWFNTIPLKHGKSPTSPTSISSLPRNASSPTTKTGEPVPAFYNVQGQLAMNDPLHNALTQGGWDVTDPSKPTGCHFINGSYDTKQTQNNYCLADNPSDAADLVYQIDITIIQGSQAGIVFRVNDGQAYYYDFEIGVDGTYRFYRSVPGALSTVVRNKSSSAINKGYHSLNRLAVKAVGPDISLYVNDQLIDHIQDSAYQRGNVGVVTVVNDGASIHGKGETEAIYNNAKVWEIGN